MGRGEILVRPGMIVVKAVAMSATIEVLEAGALQLPASEHERLVERLVASPDMGSKIEAAWAAGVERRNTEIENGSVQLVPGPEAWPG